MKANKQWRVLFRLLKNVYMQATLVGLATILPFIIYVIGTNSIIAPLNIISGWDVSKATDSVIAQTPSDVNQQMLPFREYTRDALINHHELPLWNNRSFAGDVFLANPINTALSPFNILLLFTDIFTYQNVIVLLGLFFVSFSMFLLLRQSSLSIAASTLGAIAYTYAPFSVFWSIYGVVSIPMAAIPLVLYLYAKWKQQEKTLNRYLFFISLLLGIIVYTGHIQIVMLSYIVLVLAVCYDLLFSKLGIKRAAYVAGSVIVALAIGAAQIIPMVSQTPLSHRSQETSSVAPKPWGDRLTELSQIPTAYPLASGPDELGMNDRRELLIGQVPGILLILSIATIIAGIWYRKLAKGILFYVFLFIFGAFWQWNDFPQPILNALSPTLRSLATDYFLPIALIGMSVLAAYGLDWLLKTLFQKAKKNNSKVSLGLYSLPMIITGLIAVPQLMLSRVDTLTDTYYTLYLIAILLCLLFYIVHKENQFSKTFFGITIVLVALIQGWALYRVSQPVVPREIVTVKNQQLNYITSQDKNTPAIVDYSSPQESAFYDVSLINGYDSLYSSSILNRIRAINYPNITPPTYRNNALIINTLTKPDLFKNLGVSYTINQKPTSGYVEVESGVYKSNQPTPQAYFAKTITVQSKEDQLETIKNGNVTYHDVLIDKSYLIADQSSTLSYTKTPNKRTLETNSSNGGLVFIAQTYNKDWHAVIDKTTDIEVLPAYYDFSAINVPSGRHTIMLEYKPTGVSIGFGVSALAILVTSAATIYIIRKETNRPKPVS